jgi:hypothetical protein
MILLVAFYGFVGVNSFAPPFMNSEVVRNSNLSTLSDCDNDSLLLAKQADETEEYSQIPSRRQVFKSIGAVLTAGAVASTNSHPTAAATAASAEKGPTIWQSGKAPQVPGQKPKDKNDVKGTRKDPSFLRSISDCKSQCENTSSNTGLAKSKEDCLSECQDICCTTYEQCTFAIVPRI